jgi:hypothetical protein
MELGDFFAGWFTFRNPTRFTLFVLQSTDEYFYHWMEDYDQ